MMVFKLFFTVVLKLAYNWQFFFKQSFVLVSGQCLKPDWLVRINFIFFLLQATKLLDGANILNPFIDQTAFKLRAKR